MGLKGFDDRLVIARKEKRFTQEELAVRLGVTPQAISKWERGSGYPDIELLYYISEVLECSIDYLLQKEVQKEKLTESNDLKQRQQLLHKILAEPLVIEVGAGFVEMLVEEYKDDFKSIQCMREKLATCYGLLIPITRIRDNEGLDEFEYRFLSYDNVLCTKIVKDTNTISFQDICNHLERVCIEDYSKILNRQMVQTLVDNVANKYPAIVKGIIPEKISFSLLQKVLAELVNRKRSVHNLVKIIEVLEDEVDNTKDVGGLVEAVINQLSLKVF